MEYIQCKHPINEYTKWLKTIIWHRATLQQKTTSFGNRTHSTAIQLFVLIRDSCRLYLHFTLLLMLIIWFRSLRRSSFSCSVFFMMLMQRCKLRFLISVHGCSSGFLTGYRRVPILGMGQIQMKVRDKQVQSGSDDQHFPESLTCHSILELPVYSTKEIMRDRLTEALKPKDGFLM